jgi:uncharacterized protein YbjT (DUF2867 family)
MLLISGATGRTGAELARLALARDVAVRALVRDAAKGAALERAGAQVAVGDFGDPAALARAFEGVERAFLMMANAANQFEMERAFIDAAKRAGVARVVKLSAVGVSPDTRVFLKRVHAQAEAHLAASGLDYTILRPGFYMQNLLHAAATIREMNKFFLPMGRGRVGAIDIRDVAEVVLMLLTEAGHAGQTYVITGPDSLSFADMASVFSEVLGRRIEYVDMPPEEYRPQLFKWEPSEWYVDAVMALFAGIARNDTPDVTDTFARLAGRPPRSFADFVRDHRAAFG